jgi:hypothetical protein
MRRLDLLAWTSVALVWTALPGCVESRFSDGVFACNPASGADACPEGLICASDNLCRSRELPSTTGATGTSGSSSTGTTSSGGTTTSAGGAGTGGAGTGGAAGGGGASAGGGGSCVPSMTCASYPGQCGSLDDGCGQPLDCCVSAPCALTRGPGLVKNADGAGGYIGWTSMSLAAVQDGQFTFAGGIPAGQNTRLLFGRLYGFDLPPQATTVNSVSVRVVRRGVGPGTVTDDEVRIMLNETTPIGAAQTLAGNWPLSFADGVYTWSPSPVSIAQIETTTFGAGVRARNNSGSDAAGRIDFVEMTVTYSCP